MMVKKVTLVLRVILAFEEKSALRDHQESR